MIIDPQTNFWDNTQYKAIFKDEYQKDTSSDVMWALYLIYHPSSEYYEMPLKARTSLILRDFLTEDYDLSLHEESIKKIQELSLTKTQLAMFNWESKLEERDSFISSQPYDANSFEMLDKMMSQSSKLWDQYFSLRKQLEKDEGKTRGDVEENLSERGII